MSTVSKCYKCSGPILFVRSVVGSNTSKFTAISLSKRPTVETKFGRWSSKLGGAPTVPYGEAQLLRHVCSSIPDKVIDTVKFKKYSNISINGEGAKLSLTDDYLEYLSNPRFVRVSG